MLSYTIAALADSDNDGLTDTWENTYFGNLAQTGSGDPDSDGLTNSGELTAGTDPTKADTDNDGLNDGAEVTTHTTNPLVADTDGDGVNDGAEIAAGTNPKKTNYTTITVAGNFQGWSPTPTNSPSNTMTRVNGDEFGWELNFKMSAATNYVGKFVNGTSFTAPNNVNWGTSATPGTASLGGFGNDIPFNVTATGIYRFYFNTDTLSYTFARVAAPANYADWAAQYGLAAGSGSADADSDLLSNNDEFAANSDPTVDDTDGDGLTDRDEVLGITSGNAFLDENFNANPVPTSPLLADTDGDGLADRWEILNNLDPTDNGTVVSYRNFTQLAVTANPNGASADPDADGLTNLQEQAAGSNPRATGTGLASTYAKMVVAGSFVRTKPDGSWDEVGNAANTMQLVSNFTWKLIAYIPAPLPTFAQFKFTTGSWSTNFGENIPSGGSADGIGDLNGDNINALPAFTAAGHYMITFNDFTKAYTIVRVAATDGDSDGLPDEWEAFYGSYLTPKTTDLVPTTAYVSGGLTAAEAFAAGSNPVRDTVSPTIALAAGVSQLTWVARDTVVTLANADVTATDAITTSPTVTFTPTNVVTATDGLTKVTYTATDAAGNSSTVTRVIAVGDGAPGWRKLQSPRTASISTLGSTAVYGRIYIDGATPGGGQAPNITAELGVNTADTDPSTWTGSGVWEAATHNAGFTDGDDEYLATINGPDFLAAGTFYYAFRFKIGDGAWHYAGINAAGTDGGPWDVTNGNGTLTVTQAIARQVTYAVDMGVQIFKGAFDPATNGVEVRATFNNFGGGASVLSREGTSTIYSGTFAVEGAESSTNFFKFFSIGTNAVGYEAGSDRQAILTANGVPMNTGTNFFSGISESRKITFRVDMTTQIAKGNFNASNTVSVAGSFSGWNAVPLSAQGSNVYGAEVIVDGSLSAVEYKFVNGTTYEGSVSNRTITAVLPNLQSSTLDPVLFNNDDGIGPVITRTGDATVSLVVGDSYTDAGATATDAIDGSVTVTPSGTVDTATAGTYTITYNASDAAGNAATPVTRTVVVSAAPSGSTFASWAGGGALTNSANVGKYAIGGASSLSAASEAPVTLVDSNTLSLSAIVRTNDTNLTVVGEAGGSLTNWSTNGVSVVASTNTNGVPEGHQRQVFSVDRTNSPSRQFLRLKATLAQ